MEKQEEELALKKARQEFDEKFNCPQGYIEVRLSSCGKIGAPSVFHVKNFSVEQVMELNLTEQNERPIKLIKILQDLIYEKDVDIKKFHQKEVVELLLLMYECFYTEIFVNQTWTPTEEDWEFLKKESGGEDTDEYRRKKRALETGTWKPVFDINISKDIHYYEINPNIKVNAKIEKQYGNKKFTATFALPKFGDIITLKSFVESMYREKDKQFARITETLKFRKESEEKLRRGENINIAAIPTIPKAEEDKLKEYETEKSLFIFRASIALYLIEFDGEDISDVPLEKRLSLAQDPRIDFSTFQAVQEHFDKLEFGMKEEITALDPIMNKIVTRKYPFRLDDILSSFGSARPAKTSITFV
jgi:hypothetical protein